MDCVRKICLFHGVVLRAFWGGADRPSIKVPLGDLFGVSNDQVRPIRSLAFTANPGTKSDAQIILHCCFPVLSIFLSKAFMLFI